MQCLLVVNECGHTTSVESWSVKNVGREERRKVALEGEE